MIIKVSSIEILDRFFLAVPDAENWLPGISQTALKLRDAFKVL